MNNLDAMFQTLVAANSAMQDAFSFENTFIDSIYWDNRSIAASPFTNLNVIVPNVFESDTVDISSGPIQPTDLNDYYFQVPFDKNYSNSFVIKEWDQGRTPMEIMRKFVQPRIEGFRRKINHTIAPLFNTTNFPNYSIISGAGADVFQRADIAKAWVNLAAVGVPLDDVRNVSFTTSPLAYGNMMAATEFLQQYVVTDSVAKSVQQKAQMVPAYGAQVRYDQHLTPWTAGQEPGVLYHRYAVAGVTAPVATMANQGAASVVKESSLRVGPIDLRMQVWYSPDDQGVKVHYNCWWGVAPARKECVVLLQTA